VLVAATALALAAAAALPWLRFDFNPLHLRSASTEALATMNELAADPLTSPNTMQVLLPTLDAAQKLAERLSALPEVAQALTLASFVPEDQPAKLATIADAASLLELTLLPLEVKPPPSDAETVLALRAAADALAAVVGPADTTPAAAAAAAEATRVVAALRALAAANSDRRAAFADAVVPGLVTTLEQAAQSLQARPVALADLPPDLRNDWLAADGRARVEVFPKLAAAAAGVGDDNAAIAAFAAAVRRVAPDAGGVPVSIQEAARTIIGAFVIAGILAFVAVTVLLGVALRRAGDVARTLASLLFGGLATLGLCVALGIALNYENIIALPLLFGIGVAFNIYFVIAWRRGEAELLATPIARAVVFSALTTSTAFGSLWLSSHPGTASMGELLALSLACTLGSALFVLPALLGPPPRTAG
ncbi:MAG: hopanoid biosynthesis-associated RND transporter HpnN, partial [Pseudomonadota bacterium]|nr:hopanoid biosynthesis-associated RND transporter HpnN [Pseudomonadota bacterium]